MVSNDNGDDDNTDANSMTLNNNVNDDDHNWNGITRSIFLDRVRVALRHLRFK